MAEESKEYMPKLWFKSSQPWRAYPLGDIFEFKKNATNSREDLSASGNIHYIHYGDIHTKYHGFVDFTKNVIPFLKDNVSVKSDFICDGDIIIADASEDEEGIGKAIEVKNLSKENKAISGLHTILLRPHKRIFSPFFASYLFSSVHTKKQFIKIATGIKVYSLAKSALKNVELVVPTIAEQQKIADCLSSLDELIQAHEQKRDALMEHKKGLMQRLFPAEGETTPRWRFPEFRNGGDWVETQIKQLGKIITGKTPSTNNPAFWEGEYIWVTPTDMDSHKNIYFSERTITGEWLKESSILPENSVLITCIASIGKNCILKKKGFCNQQINAIIPDFEKYNSDFIYYIFDIKKYILINNSGISATRILSKSKFEELMFPFPTLPEQQKIADCLSSLDSSIEAQEAKIASLREHKQGLMQRLFPQSL
ncbi:MAG: hypothetical protein HDQ92_02410 [Desulfovibrio sp.]|nr:hypothetical protein [Desulfovibrio sp.]